MSQIKTSSQIFHPEDNLGKIIRTYVWARNSSPLIDSRIKRGVEFDVENIEKEVWAQTRAALVEDELGLRIFEKERVRITEFFDFLGRTRSVTSNMLSSQDFIDRIKQQYSDFILDSNSTFILKNGESIQPDFVYY